MPPSPRFAARTLANELDGTYPLVVIATDDEDDLRDQLFAAVPQSIPYRRWTAVRGLGEARLEGGVIPDTEHPAAAFSWLATRSASERSVNVFYDALSFLSDARTLRAMKEAVAR